MTAGVLTSLTDGELRQWLAEVRKVAALPEAEALAGVDNLIFALAEWSSHRALAAGNGASVASPEADDGDWDARLVEDDLQRLRATITRLRRQQAAGVLDIWAPDALRRESQCVGRMASRSAREAAAGDLAALQQEAETLAGELDAVVHRQALQTAGSRVISSTATVSAIAAAVDRALAALAQLGQETEADREAGRQAKVRAARHRSDKRVAEAEVIAAGGAIGKAERMRAEAAVMLKQDLARVGVAP